MTRVNAFTALFCILVVLGCGKDTEGEDSVPKTRKASPRTSW